MGTFTEETNYFQDGQEYVSFSIILFLTTMTSPPFARHTSVPLKRGLFYRMHKWYDV